VRTLPALALVLAACGLSCGDSGSRDDSASHGAVPSAARGTDAIALRVPRAGGLARAYVFPKLDSMVWRSAEPMPAIDRILALDVDEGVIAVVNDKGLPARMDLRLGRAVTATKTKLTSLGSADGSAIYGIGAAGVVVRLTPTGDWTYKPPSRPRVLVPQPDGSLLIFADKGAETLLWRVRPPENRIADTAHLPHIQSATRTTVGDRIYFTVDSGIVGVTGRALDPLQHVGFDKPIKAITPTPSGDRLYVAEEESNELKVVDRYTEKITGAVEFPGSVADVRMDPMGRYLIVRPTSGDSVWVMAIGTDRVIGAIRTEWRADLPAVTPEGSVATVAGADVVFVDGETLKPVRAIQGGAADFWYFFFWNGFRPRAASLDQPIQFPSDEPDSAATDTAALGNAFSGASDSAHAAAATPVAPKDTTPAVVQGFTVQFAALLSEQKAKELAAAIQIAGGQQARVVVTPRAGATIYRVVLGPFPTRADADRAGKEAKQSYWIYEGAP
jgi:cell division septation protein DedD